MNNYFQFNGRKSDEMGLIIDIKEEFVSPEYDITFVEIEGRDGELSIDNNRLKSFVYPIHVQLRSEKAIDKKAAVISQWLKQEVRYKPLILSWDAEYIYTAIFYEQYSIEATLPRFGKTVLNFRCHPVKYRSDSINLASITNGKVLKNPEKRFSRPLLKITGNGNITLKNNGKDWLILRNVDGELYIDSQTQSVYKGITPHFDKMNSTLTPLFPLLSPGENTITWTGNVTKLEVAPRWEAVI